MSEPTFTTAERLLIVPASHTAIFNYRFQLEMYELFHRSVGGRVGHMLGTPAILLGLMVALHQVSGGPWWSVALAGGIAVYGIRVDRWAAALTAVFGAVLVGLAAWMTSSTASPWLMVFGLVVGGCLVQTVSHSFEEIPPPHSGTTEFLSMEEWLPKAGFRGVLRSAGLVTGVFFWLEFWATFRIWPLQMLHVLMLCGYRPDLRAALDARSAHIVAHPTERWRSPESDEGVTA
jgi:uncharacterized membrane protein YGL010W